FFFLYSRLVLSAITPVQSVRKLVLDGEDGACRIWRLVFARDISAVPAGFSTVDRLDSGSAGVTNMFAIPLLCFPQLGQHSLRLFSRLYLCSNDRIERSPLGFRGRFVRIAYISFRTVEGWRINTGSRWRPCCNLVQLSRHGNLIHESSLICTHAWRRL